jgi:hypothetical protein
MLKIWPVMGGQSSARRLSLDNSKNRGASCLITARMVAFLSDNSKKRGGGA